MPCSAIAALHHPEGFRERIVSWLDIACLVVTRDVIRERAGEAHAKVLLLVLRQHGPRRKLEHSEIEIAIDGPPCPPGFVLRSRGVAQVQVSHTGWHAIHREQPCLCERMCQALLPNAARSDAVDLRHEPLDSERLELAIPAKRRVFDQSG